MNTENTNDGHETIPNDSMSTNYVYQMNIENQYENSSSNASHHPHDENVESIIEFGPIKVKQRNKPALTLSTGRRSKYETLTPEEDQKRIIRRARNRQAAERVRINRLNIEQQLQNQIHQLELKEQQLNHIIQRLHQRKLQLQSRVFTHEKMCSFHMSSTIQPNLNTTVSSGTFALPMQATKETTTVDDNILDNLLFEIPALPIQNTDIDLLANMSPDDIEDYLINP